VQRIFADISDVPFKRIVGELGRRSVHQSVESPLLEGLLVIVELAPADTVMPAVLRHVPAVLPNAAMSNAFEPFPLNALLVRHNFSGHGPPDPKTGDAYLIPWDGDSPQLAAESFNGAGQGRNR
jgi:hypothetical protein